MSFQNAYSAYQKTNVNTASQGRLVVLLYEGAIKQLTTALTFIDEEGKIKPGDIEKFGICIAVENMFYVDSKRKYRRGMLHTPEELTTMVKRLGSRYFVACADIGHLAVTLRTEPEDFISSMDPSILTTLHVHDNEYIMDQHLLPYTAAINWEAVMVALKNIGYKGDLTFEICGYLRRFPNELIPDALKFSVAVGRHLISIFNR